MFDANNLYNTFRRLIDFAEDHEQAHWKGYIYGLGFFSVCVFQSMFFNMHLFQSITTGFQTRSVLIDAIIKKVNTCTDH